MFLEDCLIPLASLPTHDFTSKMDEATAKELDVADDIDASGVSLKWSYVPSPGF